MKKSNRAAFVLTIAVLLTACGRTADTTVTTEEIVVPKVYSEDILVNSLEYLLEEPEEEQIQEEETSGEAKEAEEKQPRKEAVICYGRDWNSGLKQETLQVSEVTPEVLLGALARHNIVPLLDTRALSMEEREQDGQKVLYLDLSGSFGEYMRTMSEEAECIIASSVVNTFLANYDADAVYLTVEGETLQTSHAVYTEALSACTPAEMKTLLMPESEEEEKDRVSGRNGEQDGRNQ